MITIIEDAIEQEGEKKSCGSSGRIESPKTTPQQTRKVRETDTAKRVSTSHKSSKMAEKSQIESHEPVSRAEFGKELAEKPDIKIEQ